MGGRIVYLSEVNPDKPPRLFEGEPDVMDVKRAADLLGVSPRTIRREVARGALESAHVGACVRITKAALVRYLGEVGNNA